MERRDAIRSAYRMTGSNSFYDGMITCSTPGGRAVCRIVWDMDKAECDNYLEKALSGIPEGFSGKLLEVPVGTGILTMPVYKTLPDADITCLDYSPDMMGQAREKAEKLGLKNVTFSQGDVGALPYEDWTFDIVLSLNGFHAFPNKDAACHPHRRRYLCKLCRYAASVHRQPCRLDEHARPAFRPRGDRGAHSGAVCAPELTDADLLRGHVPAHPRQRLRGADGEDGSAAADVHISPARLAARICSDPGHSAAAGRGGFHLGFCTEPRLRERSALHLDGGKRRLGRAAAEDRGGKMTWMKK